MTSNLMLLQARHCASSIIYKLSLILKKKKKGFLFLYEREGNQGTKKGFIVTCSLSYLCQNIATVDFLRYLLHILYLLVFILIWLETPLKMNSTTTFPFDISNDLALFKHKNCNHTGLPIILDSEQHPPDLLHPVQENKGICLPTKAAFLNHTYSMAPYSFANLLTAMLYFK